MKPQTNQTYSLAKRFLKSTSLFNAVRRVRNHIRSKLLIWKLRCGGPFKLEVGGGQHPTEGYVHIDALDNLPSWQVDIVHDVTKPLPFPDARVSEIVTNHCIEHVSWRVLPAVLKEYHRVLVLGGSLSIRTPDLDSILKNYFNKTLNLNNEAEVRYLQEHFGGVTQSWAAILKLFAGQDYPTNFHYACYDFATLRRILFSAGFSHVDGPYPARENCPDEMLVVARK